MKRVNTIKTRVGVIYTCSLNCGEGGGRDVMIPIDSDIQEQLDEKCPSCEKGLLLLDVKRTWNTYQTELTEE
jgi:hypothetical protein